MADLTPCVLLRVSPTTNGYAVVLASRNRAKTVLIKRPAAETPFDPATLPLRTHLDERVRLWGTGTLTERRFRQDMAQFQMHDLLALIKLITDE